MEVCPTQTCGDVSGEIGDCLVKRGVPPKGGASKKKKPYAAHKIFYSRLRAKASFALAGNKKTGRVPGFFFFGGEGGIRTPGTLTSSAV